MAILSHDTSVNDLGRRSALARAWGSLIGVIDDAFSDKRRNVSRPKLLFATSSFDAAILVCTGLTAYALFRHDHISAYGMAAWTFLIALATTLELRRNWSYSIQALRRPSEQIGKIVRSALAVFCIAAGAGYLIGSPPFTPTTGAAWLVSAAALIAAARYGLARILARLTDAGRLVRRTVIVGGGPDAEHLINTLESNQVKELSILGVFDDRFDERSADSTAGYPKLGTFDQLPAFCRNAGVDLMIVTVPMSAEQRLMQILQVLFTLPVDIRISALSSKLRLSSGAYSYIGRVPMLALMDRPLTDWDRVIKNIEDRVLGTLLFILAAPVMALVALAIRIDSNGPILFKQRRFGFNNELIEVLKFRSMYTDMADASASKLVTKDDPRVTPVGRFIRKTSLDELPQLLNVIKGEMSLVGPRPHATEAKASSDLYQTVVGEYFARHRMKPGVTGWAQINGWRGETDTHEKIQRRVEADLYYIDNWSLLFDLYIIAATPFALLSGKNAY
ncbi:MAG TPA: undecaprenyl-phosphate glucose phosphotransferase [Hyphomicrobium sp.]|nr:undecaprenyl-phosphate glucose phosphotransferase [Hyphomicrobium sp.]